MKVNLAEGYLLAPGPDEDDEEIVKTIATLLGAERPLLYIKFAKLVAPRRASIMIHAMQKIREIGEKEKMEKDIIDEYADNVSNIIEEICKQQCSVPYFAVDILERFEDNLERIIDNNLVIQMIDKKIANMNIDEKLQELILNGCKIKQFSEEIKEKLRKCTNLTSLHLNGCQIESLQDFPNLPKLIKLEMSGNMFKGYELKILANCASNIQELYINNNEIKEYDEIASLGQLKNLKTLHLIGCEICTKADYREKIFSLIPSLQMLDFVKKEEKKVSQTDLHYGNLFKDNNQVEEKEELACSLHYNAPFILYCGDASCHKFKLCELCCTTHEHPQQKRIGVTTVKTKFYEQLTSQVIEEYDNLEQSNKAKIEAFTQKFNEYYVSLEKKLLDFLTSFKEKLFSTHREIVQNIIKENKSSQTLWKNYKDSFENLKLNSEQPVENKLKEYLGYALRVKRDLSDKVSPDLLLKRMKESEDSVFKIIEKQFQRIFDTFSNPLDNKEDKLDSFPKGAPLFGEFKNQHNIPSGQDLFKRAPLFAASNNQELPGVCKEEKLKIEEKIEESKSSQREIRTIVGIKIDNKGVNQESSNPFLAVSESTNLFRKVVEKVDVSSQTDVENSGSLSDSKNVEIQNIIKNLISLESNLKKIMDNKKEWKSTCSAYHTSSTYYHVGPRYWVADLVTSMYDIFDKIGSHIAKLHSIHQEEYEDKTLGDPSVKKTESFLEKFA